MKKENIGYLILIIMGVLAIFSLMLRNEEINKKELPATTSNSFEFQK